MNEIILSNESSESNASILIPRIAIQAHGAVDVAFEGVECREDTDSWIVVACAEVELSVRVGLLSGEAVYRLMLESGLPTGSYL